jgi:AcrR family transcriptional regulator
VQDEQRSQGLRALSNAECRPDVACRDNRPRDHAECDAPKECELRYAATSTLEIATRAHVSKRELYALVGNKQKMLVAAIAQRAKRFKPPPDMPVLRDHATLAQVLTAFGTRFVLEVSDPHVVSVFRLAIAEAVQAPEVAQTLDSSGRETGRAALRHIMTRARAAGLIDGSPADLAEQFAGLLWRDLLVILLPRCRSATESPRDRSTGPRRGGGVSPSTCDTLSATLFVPFERMTEEPIATVVKWNASGSSRCGLPPLGLSYGWRWFEKHAVARHRSVGALTAVEAAGRPFSRPEFRERLFDPDRARVTVSG